MIASSGSSDFVESSYCDPPKTLESSNGVEQHDADCAAAAYRARTLCRTCSTWVSFTRLSFHSDAAVLVGKGCQESSAGDHHGVPGHGVAFSGAISAINASIRARISSRIGRTAATPWPAGSSNVQSS